MDFIELKNVWEMYRIKFITDGKVSWDNFWALKDVSFKVKKGEAIGIIGENGAGKSTILKLIAGMIRPDRGELNLRAKVSGLLELGAGFQPELTGRENIYLSGSLFGLTQAQIDKKYDEIEKFASLGKFINAPVKCYSQGMFVRLAFSIAIHMDPDVLLIDDILMVGDEYYQGRCIKKIFQLKEQGKTIVFVTHDMNMLRRLCKRTIMLKEGRIVKDGLTEDVIPLYSQMVGAKEGVGSLMKGDLTAVFNNGRLFLNWKDVLLTPHSGVHTSFRIGERWRDSSQAYWEVEKESDESLTATGTFYQLGLTQTWRLQITKDGKIRCDIEIDSKDPIEIEERCTSIMLTDAYTEWFTPMEKGSFPQICEDANSWQQMIEANIFRRCIGVRSPGTSGKKMPSLLFEQPERPPSGYSQILNTDYYTNSRVLQYKSLGAGNYSVSHGGHLLYFSGEISFDTPDLDKYLKSLEDETSLSCGSLRLILREGRMALSWGGTDLTKDQHMSTSVCINGNWYHSSSARWNIKKLSEDLLVAEGFWHELSVVQIWTVELTGKDSFIWKIGMRVDKDIHIQQQHMELMFTPSYDRWFSDYDTGGFPLQFLELEQDSVQRCIPDGIVGLQGKEERYPALNVGFSDKIGNFAKVFNSDFYSKARVVRIDKVEKEADATLSPGKYRCFETEVSIGKARPVDIGSQANILEADGIKFAFDAGSGRIYWKGEEQTKRLGLYSSLRSGGRWHTSASSAIWKLENKDASAISAIGRWRYLPLTQYWQIRLLPEGSIGFKVDMQVDDEIEIDRLQMSLMLSERYLQWFRGKDDKGEFPPFRGDVDDDWDCIWSGRDKVCIGVTGGDGDGHLPQVLFNPEGLDEDWSLTIVNSDIYHRGRVLQLCNTKKALLKPGQYAYAQGKITVGNLLW